jgi:phage tail sheath protein FI
MTLPDVEVSISQRRSVRLAPPSIANWFVVGFTERGPVVPTLISSLAEYVQIFGQRVSYGRLYDALEVFFREGGAFAYVQRLVGPSATVASAVLFDQAGSASPGDVAFTVFAKGPSAADNSLNVEVTVSSGKFTLKVSDDVAGVLEVSPLLENRDEAIAWALSSDYIVLELGSSDENPRAQGPVSLSGGDDDRASVGDTEKAAALALFTKDYGTGQVSFPGLTSDADHDALLAHAFANHRFARLDLVDTNDVSALVDSAISLRGLDGCRFAAAYAPWAVIDGLTPGATRTVPYSAVQAGLTAHSLASGGTAGTPVAVVNGVSRVAIGLSQEPFSDDDREALNDAGVNVARLFLDEVQTYGNRTLANPLTDALWYEASGSLVMCALASRANEVAQQFELSKLDGHGHKLAEFGSALTAMILDEFYRTDDLFGNSPEEAFSVNVGSDVNTPQTIAARELHAVIEAKTSPGAERVEIEITRVATQEAV